MVVKCQVMLGKKNEAYHKLDLFLQHRRNDTDKNNNYYYCIKYGTMAIGGNETFYSLLTLLFIIF